MHKIYLHCCHTYNNYFQEMIPLEDIDTGILGPPRGTNHRNHKQKTDHVLKWMVRNLNLYYSQSLNFIIEDSHHSAYEEM